jgi:hypothetical protein
MTIFIMMFLLSSIPMKGLIVLISSILTPGRPLPPPDPYPFSKITNLVSKLAMFVP